MGCLKQICVPFLMVKQLMIDSYKFTIKTSISVYETCQPVIIGLSAMLIALFFILSIIIAPGVVWYFAYFKHNPGCITANVENYGCSIPLSLMYGFLTLAGLFFIAVPIGFVILTFTYALIMAIFRMLVKIYTYLQIRYNYYHESANEEYHKNINYGAVDIEANIPLNYTLNHT